MNSSALSFRRLNECSLRDSRRGSSNGETQNSIGVPGTTGKARAGARTRTRTEPVALATTTDATKAARLTGFPVGSDLRGHKGEKMKRNGGAARLTLAVSKGWEAWAKIWGLMGPALAVVPQAKTVAQGWGGELLGAAIVGCTVAGVWQSQKRKSVELTVPGKEAKITVEIGDIYDEEGVKIIPVNEYFDERISAAVARGSLHGQLIEKLNKNNGTTVGKIVREGLYGKEALERNVTRGRGAGARDRYEIGTYATGEGRTKDEGFVLVALSRTEPNTLVAEAEIADLCRAIVGGCQGARERSDGRQVCFPLMGAGLSKTGIKAENLLELLIQVVMLESAKLEIAKKIKVVVTEEAWSNLDLNETKRRWSI